MTILAAVHLRAKSGLPEDDYVNQFVFDGPGSPAAYDAIELLIEAFYNTDSVAQSMSIESRLSGSVSRVAGAHEIRFYDLSGHLDGSPHGSPVQTNDMTLTADADAKSGFPEEVSVCLSFAADYEGVSESIPAGPVGPEGDIKPRARRRGRLYIGPLNADAVAQDPTTKQSRVNAGFQALLVEQAETLMAYNDPNLGGRWAVWSRADAELRPVTRAWVDNAFDTQRRRGGASTSRVSSS